jgi:hypothetical protein
MGNIKNYQETTVRDLGYSEFNPAYVVAILASLPRVTHNLSPIILKLH